MDASSAKLLCDSIDRIFTSAAKNHTEQKTVRKALDVLQHSFAVTNTHISGCSIEMKP